MGNDDKGLLEDLIGESLEETQTALGPKPAKTKGLGKMTKAAPPEDDFGAAMDSSLDSTLNFSDDLGSDDQLLGELVQKKTRSGNKRLIVLIVIFVALGMLGAAVKFKFVRLPIPKFIYDPKKELALSDKVTSAQREKVLEELRKRGSQISNNNVTPPSNPALPSAPVAAVTQPPPENPPTVATAPIQAPPVTPPVVNAPPAVPKQPAMPPVVAQEPKIAVPVAPPVPPPSAPMNPAKVERSFAPISAPREEHAAALGALQSGNYSIRVGTYLFKSSLKAPMAKLVKLGFQPEIGVVKKTVPMHKVFVGNFKSLKTAEAAVKELAEEGIQAKVESREKGTYSAVAGTYFYSSEAQKQKKKLEEFGFDVSVDRVKVMTDLQALNVGRYVDEGSAQADLNRIKSSGLSDVVIVSK